LVNPQIYWSFHGFCLWPGNFQAIFAWISPPKTNRGTIVIGFDVSFRGLSTNPQSHDPSHRTHLSILSRSTMRFPALGGCCGDGGRAGHSGHPNWGWWLDKYDQIWLLVGGLEHGFYFSTCIYIYISIGNNNPNWRSHIFQRGSNHQPDYINHVSKENHHAAIILKWHKMTFLIYFRWVNVGNTSRLIKLPHQEWPLLWVLPGAAPSLLNLWVFLPQKTRAGCWEDW
jgi:hypothetical protein